MSRRAGGAAAQVPVAVFLAPIGLAWVLLALGNSALAITPVFCAADLIASVPSGAEVAFVLSWVSPERLAASWCVMLVAMMAPVAVNPMRHVGVRSLPSERSANRYAFLLGFLASWAIAGVGLMTAAVAFRVWTSAPAFMALGLAVAWQATPWKKVSLNRCHARPPLARIGRHPAMVAIEFGGAHAVWCIGACAPIMLVALVAPGSGTVWMLGAALWIWAERTERPQARTFGIRVPLRAVRTAHHRAWSNLRSVATTAPSFETLTRSRRDAT